MKFGDCKIGLRVNWLSKAKTGDWGTITGIWHDGRIEIALPLRHGSVLHLTTNARSLLPLSPNENAMHNKAEAQSAP